MMNVSTPAALQGGGGYSPAGSVGAGTGAAAAPQPAPAVAATQQAAATPPPQISNEQVKQAMEKIMAAVAPTTQGLQFSMDESSGRTVITVVDSSTNEVIRQIPSEEALKMAQELQRMQGLLLNQKA